jgi:HlyD family secretion protein
MKRQDLVSVITESVKIRNVVHSVSGTGKIRPEREVKISSEAAGEIITLPIALGQRVKAGDLVVKIKPDNYVAAVKQAEATFVAAKSESLMRKAQMLNDELDRHRIEELFLKKLVSEAEHTAAETRAEVSRAAYEASLAQIEVAQSNLDQNKDLLAKCTITSPMDGTVESLTTELGERVVATGSFVGTEIMRIADLQSMQVWVDINENDIVNVKLGNRAEIHLDAYPDHQFAGVVERIASMASVQNQGTQQEVTNFEVRIGILRPELPLHPGMSASVEIETQTAHQVVSVPVQAVTVRDRDTGKSPGATADDPTKDEGTSSKADQEKTRSRFSRVLFVVHGDSVKMVPVQIGIADENYIQILSGIKAGDEVVSGPYTAISRDLDDGSAVKHDRL